jgi:chromosome partition protein MukF
MDKADPKSSPSRQTVPEAIEAGFNAGFQLNIGRLDMAFLSGIGVYIEIRQSTSLHQSDLESIYAIVNDYSKGKPESLQQRTQAAIERLLKNQVLIRVDGGGLNQQPVFDLSSLGKAVLDFLANNVTLTKQNLTIIASRIISVLSDIRKSLGSSGSEEFWDETVHASLKHVIVELLNAIEKRQRGLDLEQEEVRNQISNLLEKSWLDALEACETLLQTTGQTLQELYRTLLAENSVIKQGLNEIFEKADESDQNDVMNIIDIIYLRLEQIEQWGKDRVASWSQYYRRVNDFLQSIVRFDPNRELSQKLKGQIRGFTKHPWILELIDPPVYRTLQQIHFTSEAGKVSRPIPEALDGQELDDDGNLVLDLIIEEIKGKLKEGDSLNLAEIIRFYLERHSLDQVYPHIGTLIDLILKEIKDIPPGTSEWERPVKDLGFEMQNLVVND